MDLSEQQVELIAQKVAALVRTEDEAHTIQHAKHHEWVENRIRDERQLKEIRKRIVESTVIWALPIALFFLGKAIWYYVKAELEAGRMGVG